MNEFGVHYPELPPLPKMPTVDERNADAAEISAKATQQATLIAQQSLSVAEDSLTAASRIGWSTFGVTLGAALLAGLALSTWRTQMYGEHQYASAVAALKILQETRQLIQVRRGYLHMVLAQPGQAVPALPRVRHLKNTDRVDRIRTRVMAKRDQKYFPAVQMQREQRHYDFATHLTMLRDRLEGALVGLEHRWGAEFTALLNAAITRMREVADASQIETSLNLPTPRSYAERMAVQRRRTVESEQTDPQVRALFWMGVPSLQPGPHEADRLFQAAADIFAPFASLEDWLNGRVRTLTTPGLFKHRGR